MGLRIETRDLGLRDRITIAERIRSYVSATQAPGVVNRTGQTDTNSLADAPTRRRWIIGLLSAGTSACRKPAADQSPPQVVIRVATDGFANNPLVQALQGPLQTHYPSRIETVQNDLPTNAALVEESRVELAVLPVNVAYLAYTQGWGGLHRPHSKLRAIAALYTIPVYLIASESSGIRKWSDIRGKRIATGPPNSTTLATVKMTLEGLGLSLENDIYSRPVNSDAAVEALRSGAVDAVFHRGIDPPATIPKLLRVPGVKIIPITRHETEIIRSRHPFLHPLITPAGMYGNHPEVETLGVDCLVVCRDDLPEDLVYAVARSVFESLAGTRGPASGATIFQPVDLRQIHATQIPLHAGAARYFRERELFQ